MKPHSGDDSSGQQAALESFYKVQADVYDASRKKLLCGREDMLALLAAQLKFQAEEGAWSRSGPIWVDIGGGTGYNIEAMQAYLDVPDFFSSVYLVDLSPSLCEVARKRFARLGWKVKVVCQDARNFRLEDHLEDHKATEALLECSFVDVDKRKKADLITMSYSLSMIPDYYNAVDSLSGLLAPLGLIGVVDFYVQSIVETAGRNYIGGSFNRHVNWLSRVIWRSWFDCDRVGLEGARRDYLEYRFGTRKSLDERNYLLGGIPYYIFLGCHRQLPFAAADLLDRVDASCTESPYLSPRNHHAKTTQAAKSNATVEIRSKAYQSAIINLNSNLPLPSTFYQNHQRRIYYNDQLKKHTQFNNDYLYAFTWEDPRVDQRLLKIEDNDVVLCLTSAGDNLLEYLVSASPKRIHAVDLNPNQNHLLELKIAAFQALSYADFWKMFGEGKYVNLRHALISKLSPHMSSQAFQFWLKRTARFTSRGFYESGGSGHAIRLVRWLSWASGITSELRRLSECKTLNEQREIWPRIRRVLLSRALHWAVIGTEWWVWKAAGVPPAQRQMILADHLDNPHLNPLGRHLVDVNGEAMWEYIVNTLDPVARDTLISDDNYHYLLTVKGSYSRTCYPQYLSARAHAKLSRPDAFAGLRIHTDEINEVIARIKPATLTIAVIMDSMDWFDSGSDEAAIQIQALNHALILGGRVMLRSAGLRPWYVAVFERLGFSTKRVAARLPGTCIDRVNMYASTWIMTKTMELRLL